jgi:hypothetical protein
MLVNDTSVTVAVHFGLGHDPAGALGACVATVYLNWPFLGVGRDPVLPSASKVKL